MQKKKSTAWEESSSWYDKIVGQRGHYYHQKVIIPGVLKLLREPESLLDLACGQGILARHLPKKTKYLGIDGSPSLIQAAKEYANRSQHQFLVHDLTLPLSLPSKDFAAAACILALQNFIDPLPLLESACAHVRSKAPFCIVLNHPCFRIPRQSSWGVDTQKKIQYRRVDRYMTPLEIPIQTHPGKMDSESTLSVHHPLSYFSDCLHQAGFYIEKIEEWCSDKVSSTMENRSRKEFPLFLTILAKKF